MSFSVESQPDNSIIIARLFSDFDPHNEMSDYIHELKSQLDQMAGPSRFVSVVEDLKLGVHFSDVVSFLGLLTQGDLAVFNHPNLGEIVVVTNSDLIGFATKALNQSQYGGRRATVVKSLEDALALPA